MAARFSERIGKRTPKVAIQTDTMDNDLRNGLWNVIYVYFLSNFSDVAPYHYTNENPLFSLYYQLWTDILKLREDEIATHSNKASQQLKDKYFFWDAFTVYDVVDFLSQSKHPNFKTNIFIVSIEQILRRELSGYSFVDGQLAPIVSDVEIDSIEQALQSTAGNAQYKGASIHLGTALEMLSDRREPDYRNSIKESISAVESICQAITSDPKATLGAALKKLEQKIPIHGALKEGLLKLYGYTSDGDGIRHALQEESTLNQEDALFMLVTCSAFVNYLIVKADKIIATN